MKIRKHCLPFRHHYVFLERKPYPNYFGGNKYWIYLYACSKCARIKHYILEHQ